MHSLNIRKVVGIFTLGAAVVIGTGVSANAQNGNWGHIQSRQEIKQKQKMAKQQAKLEQQRLRIEQARLRASEMRQRQYQNNTAGITTRTIMYGRPAATTPTAGIA